MYQSQHVYQNYPAPALNDLTIENRNQDILEKEFSTIKEDFNYLKQLVHGKKIHKHSAIFSVVRFMENQFLMTQNMLSQKDHHHLEDINTYLDQKIRLLKNYMRRFNNFFIQSNYSGAY